VRELAGQLTAPVGYSLKGKVWLEHDNPNAVGMTGLLGYGGCHGAINNADLLLMLGTDFPFSDFLPHKTVKTIQVDRDPGHVGRRAPLELGVDGVRVALRLRRGDGLPRPSGHRAVRRRRLHDGRARRPADPGPAQGARRQRDHQQRHARLRQP
jgi:thiamine pyrophosphate-dependent acetolactate synthase large subunit-like protein